MSRQKVSIPKERIRNYKSSPAESQSSLSRLPRVPEVQSRFGSQVAVKGTPMINFLSK
jgi:hypothetical protein